MRPAKWTPTVLCAALLALAVAGGAGAAATSGSTTGAQRESSLLAAMNATRAAHGLAPLRVDGALVRAARGNTTNVMRTKVLSHSAFRARLAANGARGPAFGENVAWAVGSRARAASIVRSWLASPGHRANLLRPGFRRVGVGVAQGTFGGHRGAVVATATFAGR